MKNLSCADEKAIQEKELESSLAWIKGAKGVKNPKQLEAYQAGFEQGFGIAIVRLAALGYFLRGAEKPVNKLTVLEKCAILERTDKKS